MYVTDNDPTQMIHRSNSGNQRRLWLAAGAGVLAVAVLVFLLTLAFSGRGDLAEQAQAAPVTPTPSAEPGPEPVDELGALGSGGGQEPGDNSGDQDGDNNPGNQGNQGEPGNAGDGPEQPEQPEEPEEPEEPGEETPMYEVIPLVPTISASVSKPAPVFSCVLASAKITVTGALFAPMEIEYQFYRLGFVTQPLGEPGTVTFDEPGDQVVTVALPKNPNGHLLQLRITSPQQINSDAVIYPGCD